MSVIAFFHRMMSKYLIFIILTVLRFSVWGQELLLTGDSDFKLLTANTEGRLYTMDGEKICQFEGLELG